MLARAVAGELKEVALVIKADVQGSAEAIQGAVLKLAHEEVKVRVLLRRRPDHRERRAAGQGEQRGDHRLQRPRHRAGAGDWRSATASTSATTRSSTTSPTTWRRWSRARSRRRRARTSWATPRSARCSTSPRPARSPAAMVTEGLVKRGAGVRLLREGVVIHNGQLSQLKRFKDDVREVARGYECGLSFAGYNDLQGRRRGRVLRSGDGPGLSQGAHTDRQGAEPAAACAWPRRSATCSPACSARRRHPRPGPGRRDDHRHRGAGQPGPEGRDRVRGPARPVRRRRAAAGAEAGGAVPARQVAHAMRLRIAPTLSFQPTRRWTTPCTSTGCCAGPRWRATSSWSEPAVAGWTKASSRSPTGPSGRGWSRGRPRSAQRGPPVNGRRPATWRCCCGGTPTSKTGCWAAPRPPCWPAERPGHPRARPAAPDRRPRARARRPYRPADGRSARGAATRAAGLDITKGPLSAQVRARRAGRRGGGQGASRGPGRGERPAAAAQPGRVYLPLMVALALVEVPVNRLAFELFFQEQPAVSLALAVVVGAVLMFFAHMVGTLVRRMEHAVADWRSRSAAAPASAVRRADRRADVSAGGDAAALRAAAGDRAGQLAVGDGAGLTGGGAAQHAGTTSPASSSGPPAGRC